MKILLIAFQFILVSSAYATHQIDILGFNFSSKQVARERGDVAIINLAFANAVCAVIKKINPSSGLINMSYNYYDISNQLGYLSLPHGEGEDNGEHEMKDFFDLLSSDKSIKESALMSNNADIELINHYIHETDASNCFDLIKENKILLMRYENNNSTS